MASRQEYDRNRHRFPTDTGIPSDILKLVERMASNLHTPIAELDKRAREARELIDRAKAHEKELRLTYPSFSMEERKKLAERELIIFRLSGISIRSLYERSPFRLFNNQGESFFDEPSLQTEVAILRSPHSVKDYDHPTYDKYKYALAAWAKQISREVPNVKTIIGSPADYVDIAYNHHALTFGEYAPWYNPAITETKTSDSGLITVAVPRWHQFTASMSVTYPDWSQQNNVFMPLVLPTAVGWDGPDYLI